MSEIDFGLAKLLRDDSDPNASHRETRAQTQDGIVLGTMPYMSPEQIQGKRLDHRTDIFSLGIILYEMLTGRRPFYGDTSAELISSITRDTAGPVGDLKPGTPEHLERIIRRCLMKDPRDRYQTARDVYNELRDLNATSGSSTRPSRSGNSIAVLPFTNMSAGTGEILWRSDVQKSIHQTIVVKVPAKIFKSQDYILEVFGIV